MLSINLFNTEPFIIALKAFFKDLSVPINYITDNPTSATEILKDTWKDNEAFRLMDDVYFVGMVDDAAFEGNPSLAMDKIKSDYDGILIFGVKLKERPNELLPTRSQLAEISRAFNREFYYTPVVVVFKYGKYMAFANSERLKYKQEWREGEKAGKVSLLRDINTAKLHSGHERILYELKIPISGSKKIDSFTKLYNYWQEVFSVSLLNKKFYQELSNWYFWATKHVIFPGAPSLADAHLKDANIDDLLQEHRATNVIRMLTRLLFVWFIKEKKLIPEELFELSSLQKDILKEISPYHETGMFKEANKESIFYKAILQNLFFATLNCPIEGDNLDKRKRGFRGDGYGTHRGIDYLMRHKQYFKNPDKFLAMMNAMVPFLNGGLFECLDDKFNNIYIDGFSDQMTKGEQLIVPDYLFFGVEERVDLSKEYGLNNKGTQEVAVKGLINILKSYKFTITENTPIEEDVALDPELLGKVFENLLASYNPETQTTARKQTGSFYTPREIVNYMVDESLIAYLKNAIANWSLENEDLDKELHLLTSFDTKVSFEENKPLQKEIIEALSRCTILDPACGSGAFPMGILQKMVHILQKLDPENIIWKEVQKEKAKREADAAFDIVDREERNSRLKEIDEAFDQSINDPDYARKLFLIENCIYGVDIQPIATQISKLRFFISLVVEQKVNPNKENFGIRPLPNLETKFVAANTLIDIEKPMVGQTMNIFSGGKVDDLERELRKVRNKLFSARTKETKIKYRQKDLELRTSIAEELKSSGWPNDAADKLAKWDPYDQNTSSTFFNQEWMFDIKEGFDIVIGNPPYVLLQDRIKNEVDIKKIRQDFIVASYKVDLYHLFYEKGISLLSKKGILTYITPTNFLLNNSTIELRKKILETNLGKVLLLRNSVFEASVDTSVFTLVKGGNSVNENIYFYYGILKKDKLEISIKSKIKRNIFKTNEYVINPEYDATTVELLDLIEKGTKLGEVATVNFGMQLRNRDFFPNDVIQTTEPQHLTKYHKKCYTGRDIKEYQVIYDNRYCYFNREAQSGGCWDENVQFAKEKLLVPQVGKFPVSGIDLNGYPVLNTAFLIVPIEKGISFSLQGLINSSLIRYYWSKKFYDQRQTFPKIKGTYLKEIPLPKNFQKIELKLLSQIISFDISLKNSILRDILEGVILELYTSDHMKERGIAILEFVERDIAEVMKGRDFEKLTHTEKEAVIKALDSKWSHPDNEVRNRIKLFAVRSPEILKPILES